MSVSTNETDLVGNNWVILRNTSIIVPVDGWTKIRQYILETCKENNNCPEAQKKIDKINEMIK